MREIKKGQIKKPSYIKITKWQSNFQHTSDHNEYKWLHLLIKFKIFTPKKMT